MPAEILKRFMDGEWTVSLKGFHFSNLALDEAHECVINRRLKQITSRPSAFRTVELADFMSYLDKILICFEDYVFQYSPKHKVHPKTYVSERVPLIRQMLLESNVSFFTVSDETKPLLNVFVNKPPTFDYATRKDLLTFDDIGRERLEVTVNHVLGVNESLAYKRSKLKTFTYKTSTQRQTKTKEKNLSTILSNAFRLIQASSSVVQVSPYPLALSDVEGRMRPSNKSTFRDAMLGHNMMSDMFINACSFGISDPIALYVDFLYFLHMPPPPNIVTYCDLALHLWNIAIKRFLSQYNVVEVYIIVDKPDYLPPPRHIVHDQRARANRGSLVPVSHSTIKDNTAVYHGSQYTSMFCDLEYKSSLISYLCHKFLEYCHSIPFTVIDCPAFPYVCLVRGGNMIQMPGNEHGEADYAIWYHVARSTTSNALVLSKDTDTWVYGLSLIELGFLEGKHIIVQRGNSGDFVDLNIGTRSLARLPFLSNVSYPVTSLVSLYVLTGCDYVSSFFRLSKKYFLKIFLDYADYICTESSSNSLVNVHESFESIDISCFINLACTAYLMKHSSILNGISIDRLRMSLVNAPLSEENRQLLLHLGYSPSVNSISTLKEWHDFVRRITFHLSNATKDFEACLLPSYSALCKHALRATYVLKLLFSVSSVKCSILGEYTMYGWISGDGEGCIEIDWDDASDCQSFVSSNCVCGCKTGCNTKRCKCFSCSLKCNVKCKGRGCKNVMNDESDMCSDMIHDEEGTDESENESGEDVEIQMFVDNCLHEPIDVCI